MLKSQIRSLLGLALLLSPQLGCSKSQEPAASNPPAAIAPSAAQPPATSAAQPPATSAAQPPASVSPTGPAIDQQLIAERLGPGATVQTAEGGAVTATLLREGVAVSVEKAPLGSVLRTELMFRPAPAGAQLEGSVELLEDEVSPVIDTLVAHGVRAVGLFSRFLYDSPRVLVLRFEGEGNPALLASGAQSIGAVLRDARLRSAQPLSSLPGDAPERGKLDSGALAGALGAQATLHSNTAQGDTVLVELPRPPAAAGARSAPLLHARFSGSDLRAALDGTLVLQEKELTPVLAALRAGNMHPVGIVPRAGAGGSEWFSLHFRAKGSSLTLVRALSQALAAREAAPRP